MSDKNWLKNDFPRINTNLTIDYLKKYKKDEINNLTWLDWNLVLDPMISCHKNMTIEIIKKYPEKNWPILLTRHRHLSVSWFH